MIDYRCIISSIVKPSPFFGDRLSVVILALVGELAGVVCDDSALILPFNLSVSFEWHFICIFNVVLLVNVSGHIVQ